MRIGEVLEDETIIVYEDTGMIHVFYSLEAGGHVRFCNLTWLERLLGITVRNKVDKIRRGHGPIVSYLDLQSKVED